jgi:uncharacterized membrane protein
MSNPQSTAKIAGHPLHPMLVNFPIAFFVGTLVSDIVYLNNGDMFWFTASYWLLAAGVVMALLAALMGFIDLLGDARIRALTIVWWHFIGNLVVVLVEAFNWYQRFTMGPGIVSSMGWILSLIAVLILCVTGWLGWEMVYRKRVGIADNGTM